jgi:hypothetical protein
VLARYIGIVPALLALSTCDPGWSYRVRSAGSITEGGTRWQVLSGPSDTSLRVSANQFTSSLTITLRVSNVSVVPLRVSPNGLHAYDKSGRELLGKPWGLLCERRGRAGREVLHAEEQTTLATGDACEIAAYFSAPVDAQVMAEVSLVYEGAIRSERLVPIRLTLEKM